MVRQEFLIYQLFQVGPPPMEQLGDWLLLLDPIVGDLTSASEEWWATRSRHPEAPGIFERVRKTDPSNCEFKLESGKSCDGAKLIFIAHQPI